MFESTLGLAEFPNLQTQVSLPPGYKAALQSCLAMEIWPVFKPDGSEPTALLKGLAMKHKGNVRRTNSSAVISSLDSGISGSAGASYNVYTDSYSR